MLLKQCCRFQSVDPKLYVAEYQIVDENGMNMVGSSKDVTA